MHAGPREASCNEVMRLSSCRRPYAKREDEGRSSTVGGERKTATAGYQLCFYSVQFSTCRYTAKDSTKAHAYWPLVPVLISLLVHCSKSNKEQGETGRNTNGASRNFSSKVRDHFIYSFGSEVSLLDTQIMATEWE